jgi:hypothetical protein
MEDSAAGSAPPRRLQVTSSASALADVAKRDLGEFVSTLRSDTTTVVGDVLAGKLPEPLARAGAGTAAEGDASAGGDGGSAGSA